MWSVKKGPTTQVYARSLAFFLYDFYHERWYLYLPERHSQAKPGKGDSFRWKTAYKGPIFYLTSQCVSDNFSAHRHVLYIPVFLFQSATLVIVGGHQMKDPNITNEEFVGEISSLKKKITGKGDAFRWETAYGDLRQAQSKQKEEDKYRRLVETTTDWVWEMDIEGCQTYSNPAIYQLLGYQASEVIGSSAFLLMHPEDKQTTREMIKHYIEQRAGWQNFRIRRVHKDGSIRSFESTANPIVNAVGQIEGFIGVDRDITERKQADEVLRRAHDELKQRLADRTDELMRANDELRTETTERKRVEAALQQAHDELEKRVADCDELEQRIADRNDDLRKETAERKRVEEAIVAAKNDWENTLDSITDILTIHDKDFNIVSENLAAKAILGLQTPEEMSLAKYFRFYHGTKEPPAEYLSQCYQTEMPSTVEMFEPYLNKHLEIRAMPKLGNDGKLVGLIHLVRDITERKKAEEQLQPALDNFQKTVGKILQVIGSAVETRDPYTVGHQARSAALARNIAHMMELSQDQITAVRMASSIHDIGKLSIPVEILSKPTKLSEIEFSMIREHPKKGCDILKDVEFPWPLAEIVHQHHERMDGSGYPRNLKGDEICIEARIMAVADVVEAMVSQRFYRPGLGIEAAMEEIEKNRGILYDNAVADACLRLFREKGLNLEWLDYKW
ncbi:MAG: PAS domain S-box protein [Deltaproteobacteria bacterium]|nr:MAG: PAS domain S-box protein [Deltaproteobacteria bacterium]